MMKTGKHRRLWLLLLLTMTVLVAQAQKVVVGGTVTDGAGEPLIGVTVMEDGQPNGVVTDLDGNYKISVAPNATLVFTYLGYEKKEVAVNGRQKIDIKMVSANEMLDELVVIGYGVQKKSDITGSISSISGNISLTLFNVSIDILGCGFFL